MDSYEVDKSTQITCETSCILGDSYYVCCYSCPAVNHCKALSMHCPGIEMINMIEGVDTPVKQVFRCASLREKVEEIEGRKEIKDYSIFT